MDFKQWGGFKKFGVELEYMIVDATTSKVAPICDELLRAVAGSKDYVNEVRRGAFAWSNELALHVLEFKTAEPVTTLDGLAEGFAAEVVEANRWLKRWGAKLMAGAMHPTMNPMTETRLWTHDDMEIYEAFHRVFDCRGHGWSNLQSVHLNLPFENEEEFGRLHAAVRIVLPWIVAMAANSPIVESKRNGIADNRLEFYRYNCRKIPSVTGRVIPEAVFTPEDYQKKILEPMYRDIAPFDPKGILQEEWLNARGAIARFDRGTIEIRVMDIQSRPQEDIAILRFFINVIEALMREALGTYTAQQQVSIDELESWLLEAIRKGKESVWKISETAAAAIGWEHPGKVAWSELEVWLRSRVSLL